MPRFIAGIVLCLCGYMASGQRIAIVEGGGRPVAGLQLALKPVGGACRPVYTTANSNGVAVLADALRCYPYIIYISKHGALLHTDTLYAAADKTIALPSGQQTMDEVVVTAQYAPASANNAVQNIEVIDRKKIDAMGAQTLRDALTNQLDIRLTQDPVFGAALSMQGSKAYGADAKILIDGVPVIGRQNGGIDLSQINLANIERIEIIKGPMSVSYGTDAIAGAVNLITRKKPVHNLEAGATTYYESIGACNITVRAGYRKNRHALIADGSRNLFDGWKPGDKQFDFDYSARQADTMRTSLWKPREQYAVNMQYSYTAPKTTLTYKLGYFDELIVNRGTPLMPYREMAFDDRYATRRYDNALFLNSAAGDHQRINALLAYNYYERRKSTVTNDLTTLQTTATPDAQDTSAYSELNARGAYSVAKPDAALNFEAGYDINLQFANSSQITGRRQSMANYALFASAEYKIRPTLTLRPGLRYGYNNRYTAPLIPSVNVLWKANDQLNIRASYGKGFRQPGLKELYFDFNDINHNIYGNTGLKAEYADNYSISGSFTTKSAGVAYNLNASVFHNNIEQLITLAAVSGGAANEYTYVNIGKFITQGAQLSGDVVYRAVALSAGVALSGAYNQLYEKDQAPKFSYSPEARGGATLNISRYAASIAVFYKYTGSVMAYITENNQPRQVMTGSYHTADITALRRFCGKRINLSGGCKNLFNVTTIPSFQSGSGHTGGSGGSAIGAGRYFFLKLELNVYQQ